MEVITKHGKGIIERIDNATYSITIYIIRLTEGEHEDETLAITESGFVYEWWTKGKVGGGLHTIQLFVQTFASRNTLEAKVWTNSWIVW